ncbi:hypothetical protein FHR32_008572 [Streptosporangium album]|uniref:Uncharacterized protein n=2 Tax=Streptosporangium album TaxID=47479 RepID=A0A7W7S5C5_9ACTN|nr:hypothetical protein [Streptosporangium album]MBB4944169.1 hypothetical protein [Streptosporangium album]
MLDHSTDNAILLHEGETHTLRVSRRYEPRMPESVDVRVVQYLAEEACPVWHPFVEIAHHVGGRYRIINLTPQEARRLAATLLACADQAEA